MQNIYRLSRNKKCIYYNYERGVFTARKRWGDCYIRRNDKPQAKESREGYTLDRAKLRRRKHGTASMRMAGTL